ncbi:glycosyltransferase [Niallia taxi]|uniref:glycosyltransferase n=1 Tax=Niallia taxi TaxID=2499688 RepID=UPI0015F38DF4|nr:glycosyltransferase [Niallia taxi]MED3964051.1 glycosyltransferase [Niallia taxi]
MLRILMQNRRDAFTVSGGDTIQMLKTKEALERNFEVSIDISTELEPDLSNYDIVHLFNVTRVHETYIQLKNAKKQNKPAVVSPIYHSINAIKSYEEHGRVGLFKYLNKLIPNPTYVEALKNLYRSIKDKKQFLPMIKQLKVGYYEQQKYVLEHADLLYTIAEEEFKCIKKELNVTHSRYKVVPNGFDAEIIEEAKADEKVLDFLDNQEFILCVARIENRKNQLGLMEALKDTDYKVVFVGARNPKQKEYFNKFSKLIDNKQFFYLGKVDHDKIMNLFSKAKVHVLPSWFEVVPLVDIEAALSGCSIVTSQNSYINEYLTDSAYYCDPLDSNSIIENINLAYNSELQKSDLFEKIKKYKWDYVVENCYQGYKELAGR